MAGRARRYNEESKLNYKKIFAVIVFFIVIVMFVIGIKKLITTSMDSNGKITTINYYTVYSNGKWGIINSAGETIIEPQYDEMLVVPDSLQPLFVCTYDVNYETGEYKTKVINEKNESIITGYDSVNFIDNYDKDGKLTYANNVLIVEKNQKYGLVDLKGKEILELEYDNISILKGIDNSLIITKGEFVGLADYKGNIIIETKYKEIQGIGTSYKNGYIVVDTAGLYGIIDFNKNIIFDTQYLGIKPIYSSNKYAVKIDQGYRIVDKAGKVLLDKSFEDVVEINEDNIIYCENDKYGIMNISSENKIEPQYEELQALNSNYYIAKENGKYGIIDINKEVQIDFKYLEIDSKISEGIVIAKSEENKYDIYDSTMTLKLSVESIEVNDEYMKVQEGNDFKYYNFKFDQKDAKEIFSKNELLANRKDDKYGFINTSGDVIVEHKYDEVTELNKYGYAGIKQDGLWGVINSKGEVIIEPKYNLEKNSIIDFIGKWHIGVGNNANYYTDM